MSREPRVSEGTAERMSPAEEIAYRIENLGQGAWRLDILASAIKNALSAGDQADGLKQALDKGVTEGKLTPEEKERAMSMAMQKFVSDRRQTPAGFDIFAIADAYFPDQPDLRRLLFMTYRIDAKRQIDHWEGLVNGLKATVAKMEEEIGPAEEATDVEE